MHLWSRVTQIRQILKDEEDCNLQQIHWHTDLRLFHLFMWLLYLTYMVRQYYWITDFKSFDRIIFNTTMKLRSYIVVHGTKMNIQASSVTYERRQAVHENVVSKMVASVSGLVSQRERSSVHDASKKLWVKRVSLHFRSICWYEHLSSGSKCHWVIQQASNIGNIEHRDVVVHNFAINLTNLNLKSKSKT